MTSDLSSPGPRSRRRKVQRNTKNHQTSPSSAESNLEHKGDPTPSVSSSRKPIIFLCVCILSSLLYLLQRNGLLRHGSSYYLPHSDQKSQFKRAIKFRNIFSTIALQHGYARQDIQKYMLYPHENITRVAIESCSTLDEIDALLGPMLPSQLLEAGESAPFVNLGQRLQHQLAKSRPIKFAKVNDASKNNTSSHKNYLTTIVLFPGLLSEFSTSHKMYDELFREEAADGQTRTTHTKTKPNLAKVWNQTLARARDSTTLRGFTTDKSFSLDKLERVSMDLGDLLHVTTLEDGPISYNIVRLHSPQGSLESIGTLESSSTTFLRRLDKFFKLMDDHLFGPVSFLGYSRGALVALETLTRARARTLASPSDPHLHHSWSQPHRLKIFISLAGVLYGTPSADVAKRPGHPVHDILNLFLNCSSQLDYSFTGDMGSMGHVWEIASNTKLLVQLAFGLADVTGFPDDPGLGAEFQTSPDVNPWTLVRMARGILLEQFRLHEPIQDYYGNVRTFKILVDKLEEAIDSLTTDARGVWWSTFDLPPDVQYYALSGTMMDTFKHLDFGRPGDVSRRDLCFDDKSLDYRTIRTFYYDMVRDGQTELSDGQVPVHRALFWPQLHHPRRLSSVSFSDHRQPSSPMDMTILGVVNAHHWPVAMPRIFDTVDSAFPRLVLLKSMALFTEMDILDE